MRTWGRGHLQLHRHLHGKNVTQISRPNSLLPEPGLARRDTGSAWPSRPGWLPASSTAARALWRGAPCPATAELRPRERARALRGRCAAEPPGCGLVNLEASPFLKGSVSSDVQPRALVLEGPPAQLALFIYVANKIRGEPNAR